MLLQLYTLLRLVSPGDAAKDTALAGVGFAPALFTARFEGALLVTLVLGLLNLLVVAGFRGLELWLKYRGKGKGSDDADDPRQG